MKIIKSIPILFCVSSLFATESLIENGDFEKADSNNSAKPDGWEKPDGLGIRWINENGHGKIICMDTTVSEKAIVEQWKKEGITDWDIPKPESNPIAATYGLSYYSDPYKIKPGQAYRISFDFKGPKESNGGKVWARGYGIFRERLRRCYETYIPCRTKDSEWIRISQCFHPTLKTKNVTEIKIMLYAYWPPGKYYFDNVVLEPVSEEEYQKDKNQNAEISNLKNLEYILFWLPDQDLNLDKLIQNQLCYRYTIGHLQNKKKK